MSDLHWQTISALSAQIADGSLSPVDLTRHYLDRVETLNGTLNAYISVYPEQAMDAAGQAEAEIKGGHYRGPLHGIPIAVKDLFQVAGMVRTCGSRMVEEGPGSSDAPSVASLRNAGAVLIGLTNLHEFAFGPTGINPHFGTARNPWDLTKVCGGSSSGSGCAVAAGLSAGALGTDTGGSVRLPASLCGIVGLKPTHRLISQAGIYPLVSDFDTGGPMARSVADVAVMMDATVPDEGFGGFAPRDGLAGLRVGVPSGHAFDAIEPAVGTLTGDAVRLLKDLGAQVTEVDIPFARDAIDAWTAITLYKVYALHKDRAVPADSNLAPDVRERILTGERFTKEQAATATEKRKEIQAELSVLMQDIDILAFPTTPVTAVDAETGMGDVNGTQVNGPAVLGRLTRFASLTGQPAISLPCGLTADGLPVGLQLAGRWNEDAGLLAMAATLESALAGKDIGWNAWRPVGL